MTTVAFKDDSSIIPSLLFPTTTPTPTPTQKPLKDEEKMGVTRITSIDVGCIPQQHQQQQQQQQQQRNDANGGELNNRNESSIKNVDIKANMVDVSSSSSSSNTTNIDSIGKTSDINSTDSKEFSTDSNDHHDSSLNGNGNGKESPKIRLTPTSKLLAKTEASSDANLMNAKRRFCCPYENCTKSYGKSSHLRSHLTWHLGLKPFVCQEPNCGKGFTRSDELNRHMRTHTGEKPFECKQCGKRFSRSDHLAKHIATHAKHATNLSLETPLNNGITSKSALQNNGNQKSSQARSSAQQQMKNATQLQIFQSNLILNAEPALKSAKLSLEAPTSAPHMPDYDGMHFMAALVECTNKRLMQESTAQIRSTINQNGHNPLKIRLQKSQDNCGYHIATELNPSMRLEYEEAVIPDERPEAILSAAATMICPVKEDEEDDNFDNTIMPEANAPPFNCVNKISAKKNPSSDERPFSCSECAKKFRRQDDLNRHIRTHTGEKPYACDECERRFYRSDHLKKHKNVHQKHR